MRIILVAMPWHSLDTPSLAVGILHERVQQCRDKHEVIDVYAHLLWADYIHQRSGGKLRSIDYTQVAEGGIFQGLGDWIFTPALHGTSEWKVDEYTAFLKQAKGGKWSDWLPQMHRWSTDFIHKMADQLLALKPDVVGFTSTFMQNVASLALAKRIKELAPHVKTMMGGANCDGPQGLAVHRNYDFLDFVVRGEGEQTFVDTLDALNGHGELKDVQGLCWRQDGKHVANPERTHAFPANQIPLPNYDAYFEALGRSQLRGELEPKLIMEGARGCWWGEKHHCTFCGLNGSLMSFRSKPPEQMREEIRRLVERHQTLDILMVDNIIDLKYFKNLLPHIVREGLNLRVHYEVKSNLTADQIQMLKDAGVVFVQPGIENLSTHVLKLMAKGISGCHNMHTLRDCEEQGLTTAWNYLFGFPGETDEDYLNIMEQIPAMAHLHPPSGAVRIALERFSPNFENKDLGFAERWPAPFYPLVYNLPHEELMDLAYLFDAPPRGIQGELPKRLRELVDKWQEVYRKSDLSFRDDGQYIYIEDRREGWPRADYIYDDAYRVALFRLLRRPQSPVSAAEALHKAGIEATSEQVAKDLAEWRKQGLVFEEAGRFVSLVLKAVPQRIRTLKLAAAEPETAVERFTRELPLAALKAGERVKEMQVRMPISSTDWEELTQLVEARKGLQAVSVVLQDRTTRVWPSDAQIAQLAARGVVEVQVPWEMEIGDQRPEESVHFLRFLRDCTARRVNVKWKGAISEPVRAQSFHHLLPPSVQDGKLPETLQDWGNKHYYGQFYWRSGTNFLLIKDMRVGREARFTLDEGPLREVFKKLAMPQPWEALKDDPVNQEVLESLMGEDLVLRLGDWFVALPYQMQHWPIPASSV
ncbi:RiPP maturation radical SAM C-methyltransferase [Hyalangium gracile]|uniref:RiPP maturation radical SAM C-methyltransferase n=1 Tax=Hyalangium gracile TaxID=394092 RepID=UPI001CCF1E91|nr:RiPP maturation radical SAM C-methyltransferase [Hyalangium gracile]